MRAPTSAIDVEVAKAAVEVNTVVFFEPFDAPIGKAAAAGLLGPLRDELKGQRVGVLLCGTNTDLPTLTKHLDAARAQAHDAAITQ